MPGLPAVTRRQYRLIRPASSNRCHPCTRLKFFLRAPDHDGGSARWSISDDSRQIAGLCEALWPAAPPTRPLDRDLDNANIAACVEFP